MYQSFYHLKRKPFSLIPNPDFLYLSKKHAAALSFLELSLLDQSGVTLLTGDVGTGKTTLIRKVLTNIDDKELTVGVITNTHDSFGELLSWVLISFDLIPDGNKAEQYQLLVNFIANEYNQQRRVILIVDEAQNMSLDTLEELRLLSNINIGDQLLWQLIIVGQPELSQMLMEPELRQFSQRISLEYNLTAFNYIDTMEYIKYRLKVAGTENDIFSPFAYAMIYYHSRGIPRIINNICEMALIIGFGNDVEIISVEIINDVLIRKKVSLHQLSQTKVPDDAKELRRFIKAQSGLDISILTNHDSI